MKLLFDFFPIILFFLSYHQAGFLIDNSFIGELVDSEQSATVNATLVATAVAIFASFIQVAYHWMKTRSFAASHLFSLLLISVLGGITLLLADPVFIQWKPTLLNWAFAAVFIGSMYVSDRNIIERMMGSQLELPDVVWLRLNLAWAAFFILSGAVNLYVAFWYNLDADAASRMNFWVNFKLFGLLGMTIIFIILQGIYLSRYIDDDEVSDNPTDNP